MDVLIEIATSALVFYFQATVYTEDSLVRFE